MKLDSLLDCDIVMKGGITSGVVYPGAVLSLSKRYRFKCIGGTSAGGIAAAIVAAAEYARERGGFKKLAELPEILSGHGADGDVFMLQLFQADAATKPLFSVLIGFLEQGPLGAIGALLKAFKRFPLLALVVALLPIVLNAVAGASAAWAVAGVLAGVLVLVIGLGADVVCAVLRLPENDFGLCRLGPGSGTEAAPSLTTWLHQRINATASRKPSDAPLTFADLWAGPDHPLPTYKERAERDAELHRLSRDPVARHIDLQMMTTDLTHGRPLRLPVPYQPHRLVLEEGGKLLFDPDEMRKFFPAAVVDHLCDHAVAGNRTAAHLKRLGRENFKHFPIGPDLPVVVAARMTLSFPALIAAIPLYQLDFRQDPPPLVRVLFSDGGITSNFPVHFFDSPLPQRPTFALNLTKFEPWEKSDLNDPSTWIREPADVNREAYASVAHITSLGGFAGAIFDTMKNWRDNAQAQLPGFRDRTIHLKLNQGEGGMNLAMDSEKIKGLNARGEYAGRRLVALFAGDGTAKTKHWNDHRFVRYRTTMSLLERYLRSYKRGFEGQADAVTTTYPNRIAQGGVAPYSLTHREIAFSSKTSAGYIDLVKEWDRDAMTLDDDQVPRPSATLRAVPPV